MNCPNCNKSNPGGLVYCIDCKNPLLISSNNPAGIEWIEIPDVGKGCMRY